MKQIKSAHKQLDDIVLTFKDDKEPAILCSITRGGLSWPTPETPGYYCVVGKKPMNKAGTQPLILLAEGTAELPSDLYEKLLIDARNLLCLQWFADFSPAARHGEGRNVNLYDSFRRFMQARSANLRLSPAILLSWFSGVLTIQQFVKDKGMEVPDNCILRSQLGQITKHDLKDPERPRFYAISALVCCMGAFIHDRGRRGYAEPVVADYAWA